MWNNWNAYFQRPVFEENKNELTTMFFSGDFSRYVFKMHD